ncbi:glycoside hydrolase family 38 N-terminal domain-containing protein [Sphaerisporangium aureirubrum]|uniref:Alpha-mannosidase n=1 Tax=Sphaerisporangium aureirubrum TaxID=1544736 RepID=A0ABW1NKI1_9ACTN
MSEIVVVPHTHWDREWYLPFQRFRMGLVRMLDEVLDTMAADPAYRFTMDGQLAAVEDYLEIRPERRADIARFVGEGRFAAGPWVILSDEFLCSGETLMRNLEYGLRGARALGGAMEVGYLPDQFGHCAQMPQILALAGLKVACLWRGVPASVLRDTFAWKGADGTVIPTRYLPGGYGNAVALFNGPSEALPDRVAAFTATMRPWRPEGPLLAMYGADHSAPSAGITAAGLRLATLGEFLTAEPPPDGLTVVEGELRSHARANILPGVISARVALKHAMGRAERTLIRYAEPLAALWAAGDGPAARGNGADGAAGRGNGVDGAAGRMIELAWRGVIACSGHDSITGCGADETAQQVAARIAEAEQIGQAVVDMVSATLAAAAGRDRLVVVNPSPYPRTALVLADLPEARSHLVGHDGVAVPSQPLTRAPTLLDESVLDDLTRLLGRVHERELFGHEIVSWSAGGDLFTVVVSRHATTGYQYADLKAAILAAAAARPGPWRVRTVAEPVVTVAARVQVPALGRTVLASVPPPGAGGPWSRRVADGVPPVRVEGGALDNGLLRVEVQADGSLTMETASGVRAQGVGRIVDGGDVGDTYNHAPPAEDRTVEVPSSVTVTQVAGGPLVAVLEVVRAYDWPVRAGGGARATETAEAVVTTRVELRAGEPYARLAVTVDNPCRDHRVRWHAGLPREAPESFAEGQYAVVRRGTAPEGGGGEEPLPTFPAEGFAAAGGLAVLLGHVTEYELLPPPPGTGVPVPPPSGPFTGERVPSPSGATAGEPVAPSDGPAGEPVALPADGPAGEPVALLADGPTGELALTLLRAVGYLSRNDNPLRDEPAGPQIATPDAQCPGPLSTRFAVALYEDTWDAAALPRLAEDYRLDLMAVPGSAPAAPHTPLPPPEARLEVTGAGVMLGALRRREGHLELRLTAESPIPTEAVITGGFTTAHLATPLGRRTHPLTPVDGTVRLPLRPFEIATLHLS